MKKPMKMKKAPAKLVKRVVKAVKARKARKAAKNESTGFGAPSTIGKATPAKLRAVGGALKGAFGKMKKAPAKITKKQATKLPANLVKAIKAKEASAMKMKKAAMKLKKESAMTLKKSMMEMKKASAMKLKMKKSMAKMGHKKK